MGPWICISWKILVWGPRSGARNVKILKCLFLNVGLSQFDMTLFLGPWCHISSAPPFGPRLVKIFTFFYLERRTFKIWYDTHFWALISYQLKILVRGPHLARPVPRKVKILTFLFLNVEPSKFDMTLIFWPWFHISWKILVRCPCLARPGPRKVKILKFLFLNVEPSKLDIALLPK